MAQAAATPKTRLSGTAMAAVSRVSLMADMASGFADGLQVDSRAPFQSLAEDRRQGQQQEQGQEGQGDGCQDPAARPQVRSMRRLLLPVAMSVFAGADMIVTASVGVAPAPVLQQVD